MNKLTKKTTSPNEKLLLNSYKETKEKNKKKDKLNFKDLECDWLSSLRIYKKTKKIINNNDKNPFNITFDGKIFLPFNKDESLYSTKINFNKKKMTKGNTFLFTKNNINDNNENNKLNTLYLNGKKLLDIERNMSKDLIGKRKKIVNFKYKDEELSPIIFVKKYSVITIHTPKIIKNAINIHYDENKYE